MSSIGLKRGTVKVVNYDPIWPKEYEKEKQLLVTALSDNIQAIEHIGSTAVPELSAKPIIDILIGVSSFEKLPVFIDLLQKLGYEYMPDRMFNDRKFFPKGSQECRTHHISVVTFKDREQWIKPLAFRDYLRTHERERNEYGQLKAELAKKYADDRYTYTKQKEEFIQSIIDSIDLSSV